MKKQFALLMTLIIFMFESCVQKEIKNLVFIEGGTFKNTKSIFYNKDIAVTHFYIGKYEVSQKEWVAVMGKNPSKFKGNNLPVENVSWYDCIAYCNKRSIKEKLKPYYVINKNKKDPINDNKIDSLKWTVTLNTSANGYRLPTNVEWDYAAGGGQKSKNYTYSGNNNLDRVGWYWMNSGDKKSTGNWTSNTIVNNHCKTHPVGSKEPNELGLYDMSGNVREWAWDWSTALNEAKGRMLKGGGWIGIEMCCTPSYQGNYRANNKSEDTGFRLCRSE
jgi:formylglycine-generating enzyme